MNNIQQAIFDTVDIITEKKINEVKFDKTIDCIIVNDSKADVGEYEVKFQDIIITAFSNTNTIQYKQDENVHVLVPQGDMSNKKTIVGRKEQRGESFLNIKDMIDQVEKLGGNYVDEPLESVFTFKTGKDSAHQLLFRKEDFIKDYNNKTILLIGANISTNLVSEQGDYGVELDLEYVSGIRHQYSVSIGSMTGNPYRLVGNYQYRIFPLILEDVKTVHGARLFIKGFKSTTTGFVTFSNVEILYAKPREVEGLDQYSSEIVTPKGSVFKNGAINQTDSLDLQMTLKKVGKEFSPSASYKWFFMDSTVNSTNPNNGWDVDGGLGWRIIDSKVDGFGSSVIVKPGGDVLSVTPKFVANMETFKCVAAFGGETINLPDGSIEMLGTIKVEAIETITDQTDAVNVVINSSMGDIFKDDGNVDSTVLTCIVTFGADIIEPSKFLYSWSRVEEDGKITPISNLQTSENLTIDIKNDILDIGNYICEVFLK